MEGLFLTLTFLLQNYVFKFFLYCMYGWYITPNNRHSPQCSHLFPSDSHLDCFQTLTVTDSAVMNTHAWPLRDLVAFFFY